MLIMHDLCLAGLEQALVAADGTKAGTHAAPIHPSSGGTSSSKWEGSSHGSSLTASQEEPPPSSGVREEDLLELGSFGAPHGVRGDIRLFPTTDSAKERLTQPGTRCAPCSCTLPHTIPRQGRLEGCHRMSAATHLI